MKTKWEIIPVKSDGPIGYKWRWIRTTNTKVVEVSKKRFDYYYDCVTDARRHGYYSIQNRNVPTMTT